MNVARFAARRGGPAVRRAVQNSQSRQYHTSAPQYSAPRTVSTESPRQPSNQGSLSNWVGSFFARQTSPPIAAVTVDLNNPMMTMPTKTYGAELGYQVRNTETGTAFRISGSASMDTVDILGTGMKLPKDLAAQLAIDADLLGLENLRGDIAKHTLGTAVKTSASSLLQEGDILSFLVNYQYQNQRTGVGTKAEGSWGTSSWMPSSLELSDASSIELMERFELEKQLGREFIQASRLQSMEVIHDTAMKSGVNPITGEGLDEIASMEFLDHTLNVTPGARAAMEQRNQKHAERFQVPLSEEVINSGPGESMGQKVNRVAEQVMYGQNGKDGRLAPKQKAPEQEAPEVEGEEVSSEKQKAPKQKTAESESPEVEGEEVESQKQEGPKQKVPDQEKEQEKESHEQEGPKTGLVSSQGRNRNGGGGGNGPQQHDVPDRITAHGPLKHDDEDEEESQELESQDLSAKLEGQEVAAQEVAPKVKSVREMIGKEPKSPSVQESQGQGQDQGKESSVRNQFKRDTNVQKTGSKIGVS